MSILADSSVAFLVCFEVGLLKLLSVPMRSAGLSPCRHESIEIVCLVLSVQCNKTE